VVLFYVPALIVNKIIICKHFGTATAARAEITSAKYVKRQIFINK